MREKKIVYSGFYGFKNVGDDVFLEVTAWASSKILNTSNIVYLGNDLPELISPSRELSKPMFKGHQRLMGISEMMNADFFISAGGSTFSRHKKNSLKQLAEYTKIYNRRLKTGAIGVSIGPFKSGQDEKDTVEYLKKMNFLAVRDKRSFEYVSSLDLPYQPVEAFDLAALLPMVYLEKSLTSTKSSFKKIIGVSVCPVESITDKSKVKNEEERVNRICELIQKINQESDQEIIFRFFIINGNQNVGDENITKTVISKSGISNYEIIPYQNSVIKAWNSIKECDFMIATRLHAGIMAAYAEVPFILNEYHQKCTDFIHDIGQDEKFIVGDADYRVQELVNDINKVLTSKEQFSLKNVEKTTQLALNNFKFSIT